MDSLNAYDKIHTKTDYTAKITKTEGKISSIVGFAINAALTTIENKIPNISCLVKKTDYNTKITETEKKILLIVIMIDILELRSLIL